VIFVWGLPFDPRDHINVLVAEQLFELLDHLPSPSARRELTFLLPPAPTPAYVVFTT